MGLISEFYNMFVPEGLGSDRGYAAEDPVKFFEGCENAVEMIDRWKNHPNAISLDALQIAVQTKIIENQSNVIKQQSEVIKKLLLLHNGSAPVSKTEGEGSTPFDSATPPYGGA